MSTVAEHLQFLVDARAACYAKRHVEGVNHMELQCDDAFVFHAKMLVSVHLDELIALAAAPSEPDALPAVAQEAPAGQTVPHD
jgi:hypothetical protein